MPYIVKFYGEEWLVGTMEDAKSIKEEIKEYYKDCQPGHREDGSLVSDWSDIEIYEDLDDRSSTKES